MSTTSRTQAFLEKDPVIRGQNWVCVSFVSPEDVVIDRELFTVKKFLSPLAQDVRDLIDHVDDKSTARLLREKYSYLWEDRELQAFYATFKSQNITQIENEYTEKNGPRTSVRAVKIRGVYDTMDEARSKCNELREFDNGLFNIYVAAVGCWVPWSPDPSEIADNVYAENQLNALMSKYAENSKLKDKIYNERRSALADEKPREDAAEESAVDKSLFDSDVIVSESGKVFH